MIKLKYVVFFFLLAIPGVTFSYAQAPEKMSYQALIRDAGGNLVTNVSVGMRISILQGSAVGTAVYEETQTPTTTARGLVSLEIGGIMATVITGTFAGIDWGADTYFLKTETDPAGGTNYTITGTSQLLSVPYALNAKSADNLIGTITKSQVSDLQPYLTSETQNITQVLTQGNDAGGLKLTNLGTPTVNTDATTKIYVDNLDAADADKSTTNEIQNLSEVLSDGNDGGGLTITNLANPVNTQDAATKAYVDANDIPDGASTGEMLYWNGSAWTAIAPGADGESLRISGGIPVWANDLIAPGTYAVGDFALGGVVAYILQPGDPGYDANSEHGIIVAVTDQSTGAEWGCVGQGITGADGTALGTGYQNTQDIVAECTTAGIAARVCNDLDLNGYTDWYLPSRDELNKLYLNKTVIDATAIANSGTAFTITYYWSSSEGNSSVAWEQWFNGGGQNGSNKGFTFLYVRAVRAF